jgi:hypothetical protein
MEIMVTFRSTAVAAAFILAAVPAFAQSAQQHDAHHPENAPSAEGQTTEPASPQAGMMDGNMMGNGMASSGGMMSMMKMMGMMGVMGARSGAEHIEGRLAFIKAELKITHAQAPEWKAFAKAVRANAKSMTEMHQSMMSRQGAPATLLERLALEDMAVTAHLTALKKTEGSLDKLYGALSSDQKKTADRIIVGPMGMLMGMM